MEDRTVFLSDLAKDVTIDVRRGTRLSWESQDEWQRSSNGYRCTLYYQGRQYTFDYWMGSGLKRQPTVMDTLEGLLGDAGLTDRSFEDFCAELGYEPDARSRKLWEDCHRVERRMRQLLGDDYETFLYAEPQ